jgi:formylglycine-generating enzyme required for sulfatase activity
MDQGFINVIKKMTSEQGADVLVNGAWKKWLADYTGAQYQKETKLFKQILEANCAEYINSAKNVPERKQALLTRLEDEQGLSPKATAEYLDLLGLILKGDNSRTAAAAPAPLSEPAASQQPPKPVVTPAAASPVPANMVRINGGTFMMGSPASEPGRLDDEVQHRVTVSSFYMGKYEVTQREWREVMGNNPSKFQEEDLPVEQVAGMTRWSIALNGVSGKDCHWHTR